MLSLWLVVLNSVSKLGSKQASKKLPSTVSAAVPALTAFDDELLNDTVSETNPFFPKLLSVLVFHHSGSNPN